MVKYGKELIGTNRKENILVANMSSKIAINKKSSRFL